MSFNSIRRRTVAALLPLALGALVFAPTASAGSFTIGDRDAVVGTAVTFWGARWWKLNELSGGEAPSSFKGWVNSFPEEKPLCLAPWTTGTGNSSEPPQQPLPEYIYVAVASKISQDGSIVASSTTPKIALVKVNVAPNVAYEKKSGYEPDPGHEGTGTVEEIVVCEGQIT